MNALRNQVKQVLQEARSKIAFEKGTFPDHIKDEKALLAWIHKHLKWAAKERRGQWESKITIDRVGNEIPYIVRWNYKEFSDGEHLSSIQFTPQESWMVGGQLQKSIVMYDLVRGRSGDYYQKRVVGI